jgi:hypothetical protein
MSGLATVGLFRRMAGETRPLLLVRHTIDMLRISTMVRKLQTPHGWKGISGCTGQRGKTCLPLLVNIIDNELASGICVDFYLGHSGYGHSCGGFWNCALSGRGFSILSTVFPDLHCFSFLAMAADITAGGKVYSYGFRNLFNKCIKPNSHFKIAI